MSTFTSLYTPFISLMTNHTMESSADLIRHSESAVGVFEACAETDTLELSTGFRFKQYADLLPALQGFRGQRSAHGDQTEEPPHCTLWEEQALYKSLKASAVSHTGYLNSHLSDGDAVTARPEQVTWCAQAFCSLDFPHCPKSVRIDFVTRPPKADGTIYVTIWHNTNTDKILNVLEFLHHQVFFTASIHSVECFWTQPNWIQFQSHDHIKIISVVYFQHLFHISTT